jgi:hypothetical protein
MALDLGLGPSVSGSLPAAAALALGVAKGAAGRSLRHLKLKISRCRQRTAESAFSAMATGCTLC